MLHDEDQEDHEEAKPFLEGGKPVTESRTASHRYWRAYPWILTAISWVITISVLLWSRFNSLNAVHPATLGWPTDIQDMHSSVSYEQRHFTGQLTYDKASNLFIRVPQDDPSALEYVGAPGPEIDANWNALLHGQYTIMRDDEAVPFEPNLRRFPVDHRFHFSPHVFHALHCVNTIRKALDDDYYSLPGRDHGRISRVWNQTGVDRLHVDHCLDQLRQCMMCFGDLSPSPMYSWPGIPVAFGQGSAHTCRKWEPIRAWLDGRNAEFNNTNV